MAYCGNLNWEHCQYRACNVRVEQQKTLHKSLIIRRSEQVELSYTFDKALVLTVLWFDAYAQEEHGCGRWIKTLPLRRVSTDIK